MTPKSSYGTQREKEATQMMTSTPAVAQSNNIICFLLIIITTRTATLLAVQTCPSSTCGSILDVHFPFGIIQQREDDHRCASYPGFNLSCQQTDDDLLLPTLQLPNAGNFTVQGINYLYQHLYISDPARCFANRLLRFNLSDTPFRTVSEKSFVLFTCPPDNIEVRSGSGFRSVTCLSSDNATVIALPAASDDAENNAPPRGCKEMERAVSVPGGWNDYDGLSGGVVLEWDWPDCRSCEALGGLCGLEEISAGLQLGCSRIPTNGLSTGANFGIALGFGIPAGILCTIALVCYVRRKINFSSPHDRHHHHQTALELSTAIVPQPAHVVLEGRSLDQSTIESYHKNILGQNKRPLPKPTRDDGICPIYLSEYRSKEALRTMPECNHYFHARCIDAWLKLSSTCPICRADTPNR